MGEGGLRSGVEGERETEMDSSSLFSYSKVWVHKFCTQAVFATVLRCPSLSSFCLTILVK